MSFSQVDLWLTCARKYYFERVQGLRSPPTHHLEVGNAYHEVIAETIRGGPVVVADFVERRRAALETMGVDSAELVKEITKNLARLNEEIFTPHGFKPFRNFRNEPLVEQKFFSEGLRFTGVIDAVSTRAPVVDDRGRIRSWEDGLCVFDWKSLSSKRRRSARDAELSEQLALYGLVMPTAASACFVEIPRDFEEPIQVRRVTFRPEHMARVRVWLERIRDHIYAAGDQEVLYPPTQLSNGLCSPMWCAHYDRCYPYNGARPASDVEGLAS